MHWNSWSNCLKRSSQPCTSRFRASVSTPGKPSVYLSKNAKNMTQLMTTAHSLSENGVPPNSKGFFMFPILYQMATSINVHVKCQDQQCFNVWKAHESTTNLWLLWWSLVQNPIFRSNAVSTAGNFSLRHRTAWWRGTPRCSCESRAGSQPLNGTSMSQNGHPFGSKDNIGKTTENPWWYGNYIGKLYRCW